MDQAAYLDLLRTVCSLVGYAVRQEVPDTSLLDGVDPQSLLDVADKHTLGAAAAMALQSAGVSSSQVYQEAMRGVWKAAQLEADWTPVREELESAGIWYCPLKGAVLKDVYPVVGMRQMADYDVLVDSDRTADVRAIMERLGFSCENFGRGNHDVYFKLPVTNFEIHHRLFGGDQNPRIIEYYQSVKDRLIKDPDNGFGWHMSATDCYLYVVAHAYKHFTVGGTGLRTPLDVYVYLRECADEIDWGQVGADLGDMGIADFEERLRTLAQHLFVPGGATSLSSDEDELFAYLASSCTYGTLLHKVENELKEKGDGVRGKLAYLVERLFPSHEKCLRVYPFYKNRLMYPAVIVYRLGRALTTRRKRVTSELRVLGRIGNEGKGS